MKYEVGETLSIINELGSHNFSSGTLVVITDVDEDDTSLPYFAYEVGEPDNSWWIGDSDVEVATYNYNTKKAITALQAKIYEGNVAAGWWENITTGERFPKGDIQLILSKLALIHSEISEALEGARKGLNDDHLKHRPMAEVELADAIIRILDLAGHEGYDVAGAIDEKLAYNAQRADHKKENRLAEGGKKV